MNELIGIGVGPGDPELMTYKAIKNIESTDLIFIPIAKPGQSSVALKIAKKFITDQKIIPLVFPMITSLEKRNEFMIKNVETIKEYLDIYKKGVFLTIGDPSVYATYMYLVNLLRKEPITIKTIPGISSFSALCSQVNLPIALDQENFCVYPLKDNRKSIEKVINDNDNVIFMKVSRGQKVLYEVLEEKNYLKHCVLASNIGKKNEIITTNLEILLDKKLSYFTTLVFKKGGIHE